MDTKLISTKFARIGARMKVTEQPLHRRSSRPLSLDIGTDRHGEFFEIRSAPAVTAQVEVLDLQPADRHLLLLVRLDGEKSKYLCGHDERHWFVAGIPESAPVGTVRQAKEALKPADVQVAQARQKIAGRERNRRKNAAYVRQGEWFFLPEPNLSFDERLVLRNEPLSRGGGSKPHWAEFCYREGGETVYVSARHNGPATEKEYRAILSRNPRARHWGWRVMRRNPGVYVRGRIRHPDHNTITLQAWHRVVMNTEHFSVAMKHVAFLD